MIKIKDYLSARDLLVNECCSAFEQIMKDLPDRRIVFADPVSVVLENGPAIDYTVSVGEIRCCEEGNIQLVEYGTGYSYSIDCLNSPSDIIDIYDGAISSVRDNKNLMKLFDFSEYK